jgi:hypothetical protein
LEENSVGDEYSARFQQSGQLGARGSNRPTR